MNTHILIQIAIILFAAKIGGELSERCLKQSAVLGEITFGVLVGKSVLGLIDGGNALLGQLAEIGAILLLFEVGLESDLTELFKLGVSSLWVACIGVTLPFIFGYVLSHAMGLPVIQSIFVGAAMTATSVGITARVFSDLNVLQTIEAKIVLGAAVADDVIGLIILAAVSGLAISGHISKFEIGKLTGIAILFLVMAVVLGLSLSPMLLKWAHRMKVRAALSTAALIFCLILSSLSAIVGLAPIVGAFAAGLVLSKAEHKTHFEEKIRSLADIFVPVFFVIMGARMNIAMFDVATPIGRFSLGFGFLLLLTAVIGKVLGGMTVLGKSINRTIVGVGMIPRGEVGLIFASVGLERKVIGNSLYAAIIFVVICSTFITPPLLKWLIARRDRRSPSCITQEDNDNIPACVR